MEQNCHCTYLSVLNHFLLLISALVRADFGDSLCGYKMGALGACTCCARGQKPEVRGLVEIPAA